MLKVTPAWEPVGGHIYTRVQITTFLSSTCPPGGSATLQGALVHFCESSAHHVWPGTWFSGFFPFLLVQLLRQLRGQALLCPGQPCVVWTNGEHFSHHVFIQQTLKCLLCTWQASRPWVIPPWTRQTKSLAAVSYTPSRFPSEALSLAKFLGTMTVPALGSSC